MKIALASDIHIRPLKRHKEYKIVFSKFYDILKREKPDIIVLGGDIAHSKTNISPEFIDLTTEFFRNLASIAPTYIILGNHDGLLHNKERQDAISPIVEAIKEPNIHLLKHSQEIHLNDKFCLNNLSIFDDKETWKNISDPNKVNIGLFHR